MPNLIQHKRSTTTRTPTLEFGEIAYTTNGDLLWIGQEASNTANVAAIGGKRTPGVLTANQAIVVNGNSWINEVKTAKLFIGTDGSTTVNVTSISTFANSTQLGASAAGSNTEVVPSWAIKTYVDGAVAGASGAPGGSNTQVQFNDSGAFGGVAGLTFDRTSNTLAVSNTLTVPNITGTTVAVTANLTVTDTAVTVTANTQAYKANSTVTGVSIVGNSTATYVLVGDAATVVNVNPTTTNINGTTLNVSSNLTVTDTAVTVTANTQAYKANSTVTGLQITGNSTATYVLVGVGATVANVVATTTNIAGTTLNVNSNLTVTDTSVAVVANTQSYKANSTVTGLQVTGNSTATYVLVGDAATVVNVNPTTTNINGTTLNVSSNISVTDTAVTVTANTQAYKANSTVTGLQVTGNSTATYVLVGDAATVVNVNPTTTSINGTTLNVNSNLNVADTTVTVTSNTQVFKSNSTITSIAVTGNSTATVVTLGGGATTTTNVTSTNTFVSSTNTTINSNVTINGTNFTVGANATFNANVIISGDLIVNGATTVINVDTLSVEDSVIKVAANNTSTDTIDFGIYGVYGSGGAKYAGLFRDSSNSGVFMLFNALTTEPTTTVDTSAISRGTLLADFVTDVFTANSTKVSITAGALLNDLPVQDGGTGRGTITTNGIMYGNTTGPVGITAAGTEGQVFQAGASGVPVFAMLDGGSF